MDLIAKREICQNKSIAHEPASQSYPPHSMRAVQDVERMDLAPIGRTVSLQNGSNAAVILALALGSGRLPDGTQKPAKNEARDNHRSDLRNRGALDDGRTRSLLFPIFARWI
jgi:hypothetical protein